MPSPHDSDEGQYRGGTANGRDPGVDSLSEQIRGAVIQPGDDGYDGARTVWNGAIDRYPAAIVRCTGIADVMHAVNVVREEGVPLSIRAGGHHTAGHGVCDDGIVLDLQPMNGVRVDPVAQTAWIQGGATWGDVNPELRAVGLDIVGVSYPEVGVGGFTLGGGIGLLSREHGLAVDNLRGVELVTAEGEFVHARDDTNADLFWALRGGSGNFGVVTGFEFDCHPTKPQALVAMAIHPVEAAEAVLKFYREFSADAPEAVMSVAGIVRVPETPTLPPTLHGEVVTILAGIHTGDPADGQSDLQPIQEFGDPVVDLLESRPFEETGLDAVVAGRRNHWMNHFIQGLSDDAIEALLDQAFPLPDGFVQVGFSALGGAINEVPEGATAYPHRDATHLLEIITQWDQPTDDETHSEWVEALHRAMADYATGGEYLNNQTSADAERVRAAFTENYDRLADVKSEWDPDNLFSMTQNIEPDR